MPNFYPYTPLVPLLTVKVYWIVLIPFGALYLLMLPIFLICLPLYCDPTSLPFHVPCFLPFCVFSPGPNTLS